METGVDPKQSTANKAFELVPPGDAFPSSALTAEQGDTQHLRPPPVHQEDVGQITTTVSQKFVVSTTERMTRSY